MTPKKPSDTTNNATAPVNPFAATAPVPAQTQVSTPASPFANSAPASAATPTSTPTPASTATPVPTVAPVASAAPAAPAAPTSPFGTPASVATPTSAPAAPFSNQPNTYNNGYNVRPAKKGNGLIIGFGIFGILLFCGLIGLVVYLAMGSKPHDMASLEKALKDKKAVNCTLTYDGNSTDYVVNADQTKAYMGSDKSKMLSIKGDGTYIWSDGSSKGTKLKYQEISEDDLKKLQNGSDSSDYKDSDQYKNTKVECKAFSDEKLSKPSGVEFTSMDDLFNSNSSLNTKDSSDDSVDSWLNSSNSDSDGDKDSSSSPNSRTITNLKGTSSRKYSNLREYMNSREQYNEPNIIDDNTALYTKRASEYLDASYYEKLYGGDNSLYQLKADTIASSTKSGKAVLKMEVRDDSGKLVWSGSWTGDPNKYAY